MYKILLLAAAGAAGTLARYGISTTVHRIAGSDFPLGTFTVNMIGCLVFGMFWAFAEKRFHSSADITAIVLIGFLGAFTTFSSFIFDTGGLLKNYGPAHAMLNLVAQNALGIALLFTGLAIGRKI